MTPEEYRPGLRVWYEPTAGVRFLGETVDDTPRKLGDTWVTAIAMVSRAYGDWRRAGKVSDADVRMSVPAGRWIAYTRLATFRSETSSPI